MPLTGSSLDYRPSRLEDQYDPREVALMKQQGVWPPGTRYPPGTKQAAQEQDVIAHIHDVIARQDQLAESRAQRRDISTENLAARRDYNNALIADRAERARTAQQGADARLIETLQFVAADTSQPAATRQAASNRIASLVGLGAAQATAAGTTSVPAQAPTGAKGSYAPGGVGAEATTQQQAGYAPPPETFGVTGEPAPGRDITAQVYGTTRPPTAATPPTYAIPQLYGGESRIAPGAGAGYYRDGSFLGPAYTEEGKKLPRPAGATGMVGTAGLGLQYDTVGNITSPLGPEQRRVVGGINPRQTVENIPTFETQTYTEPTPAGYQPQPFVPPTEAFAGKGAGTPYYPTPTPAPTPAAQPWTAEQGLMHRLLAATLLRKGLPWLTEEEQKKEEQ